MTESRTGTFYQRILESIQQRGALYWILIDPDEIAIKEIDSYISELTSLEVDAILVGGSLLVNSDYELRVEKIKKSSRKPVFLFPGSINQLTPHVDAILFLSIISGRNPNYLIGQQVIAAPLIHQMQLEAIGTCYLLIESGRMTTAEFMSDTRAIPSHKPEIAVAHALAASYLGMKLVYLEAGSGADRSVPEEMIKAVSGKVDIPVIVGGGIRDPETARQKVNAGASIVVTGNVIEETRDFQLVAEFARAIHVQ